ncbi:CAP domain-containing protein [Bacillus sp. AK128]
MINKKILTILTSLLLVLLVACNNNMNQGAAGNTGQQNDTLLKSRHTADEYVTNVNHGYTNTTADRNYANYQDDTTNNTERFNNRNTANTRNNNGNNMDTNMDTNDGRANTRNVTNGEGFGQNDNNDDFQFGRNVNDQPFIEHELENPGANISADVTDISSNKYPHTKAILIQEAKYKHVKVDDIKAKAQGLIDQAQTRLRGKANQQAQQGMNQNAANQGNKQNLTAAQQGQQQNAATQNQMKQNNATAQNQQGTSQAQQTQEQQQATQQQAAAPQEKPAEQPAQETAEQKTAPNTAISEFESKVIELTNAERRKNGLKDLAADTSLSNVAREKSTDMQKNNYFSHTSPTYGSPFDMMRDFGVTYNTAGENIAQGQRSPEEVVQAWMNSEGHRKNILSDKFTHIGVGYQQNGHHWTQMFVGR